MACDINTTENSQKCRPPERARSGARRRKRGDSEINWMGIRRTKRQIHPKGDRNSITIDKVIAGNGITVAETGLRTTRKPTKTPADKTTTIRSRTRDKENRINTEKGKAGTNQHLISCGQEHIELILAIRTEKRAELSRSRRGRRRKSEIKRSRLKIDLKTGDAERRNKKRQQTRGRKRERTESKPSRENFRTETHGWEVAEVLKDSSRRSGMTTNKHSKTPVL